MLGTWKHQVIREDREAVNPTLTERGGYFLEKGSFCVGESEKKEKGYVFQVLLLSLLRRKPPQDKNCSHGEEEEEEEEEGHVLQPVL